jgi:hypothetical protein
MLPDIPKPAHAGDTAIARLDPTERLLLLALRLWAAPYVDPTELSAPDWRHCLASLRVTGYASCQVAAFFDVLTNALDRPFRVRRPDCPLMGADEGRLLQALGLLQRNRREDAAAVLALWLPPSAISVVATYGRLVATALSDRDLTLPAERAQALH